MAAADLDNLPFTSDGLIRKFSSELSEYDLKWHWDEQDRLVTPVYETDWQFQFDNELPQELQMGVGIFVKAGTFRRLIKGTGDLFVEVVKYEVH